MDYIIDTINKKLGRAASEAALILQGKKSPSYLPNRVTSDRVIIKNVGKIDISERKAKGKMYYRHTGYMGHLKERTLEMAWKQSPAKVFRSAVERMLPKNASRKAKMRRLIIED